MSESKEDGGAATADVEAIARLIARLMPDAFSSSHKVSVNEYNFDFPGEFSEREALLFREAASRIRALLKARQG